MIKAASVIFNIVNDTFLLQETKFMSFKNLSGAKRQDQSKHHTFFCNTAELTTYRVTELKITQLCYHNCATFGPGMLNDKFEDGAGF